MTARKKRIRHPGPITTAKQYPHGTNACYSLNRCRCDDCTKAHRAYENGRKLYRGEFPRVPPPLVDRGPARRHVKKLMAQGMGFKRIAEVAGVPASAVGTLIWGRYDRAAKKIRRQTAEKLLAVTLDLAGGIRVPGDEAKAIIVELVARGWTKADIGRRVTNPTAKSLQIDAPMVTVAKLQILRRLLEEPVPLRRGSRGNLYPAKGRPPRAVARTTPGMPGDAPAEVEPVRDLVGKGSLRCKVCDKPLAFHLLTQRCA